MKNILIIFLSLFLISCKEDIQPVSAPVITASGFENFSGLSPENKKSCSQLVYAGYPVKFPLNRTDFYICRDGYALSFDPKSKTASWVVQKLDISKFQGEQFQLLDESRPDPYLSKKAKSNLDDFKGIGYEKAFFAQPSEFSFDKIAISHSYYLTNSFPLYPDKVKVWNDIIDYTKSLLGRYGELYIISGSVYAGGTGRGWVGVPDNVKAGGDGANVGKILVPTHVYRIIFDPKSKKAIAFLIPNQKTDDFPLSKFMVPVSAIEKITSIKFFNGISQGDQDAINQRVDVAFWSSK